MYIGKDNSKSLGPVWAFVAGCGLLAVACGVLCLVVVGLIRGEIWKFSKQNPGLVTIEDSPVGFWVSVVFSIIIGLILVWLSLWILRDAFREKRR